MALSALTLPLGIIDVGVGNVSAIEAACTSIDLPRMRISAPDQLEQVSKVVLPGVGNFGAFMKAIEDKGFNQALREHAGKANNSLLGVCVGAQALLDSSEEAKGIRGLGFISGTNSHVSLDDANHIPRVGWDYLDFRNPENKSGQEDLSSVFRGRYYFSHSFKLAPADPSAILATSRNSPSVPAVIGLGNIIGAQFHPERSLEWGKRFLEAFYRGTLHVT
jgi:imidazole glycerol-phosphate synthase subunit HisH